MRKISILILLGIFWCIGALQAQTIKIATDKNMWYPYSYEENGVSKGLHIDIVNQALENLGYSFVFTPLPWKRCLAMVERGKFDAIISASYKPKRAEYLYYPSDSFSAKKSRILKPILCLVFSYLGPIFPNPTIRNFFMGSPSVNNLLEVFVKSFLKNENIGF